MSNTNPIPTNQVGSKEFYETMENFERTILGFKGDPKTIREDRTKVPAGVFYCNGEWNNLFKGYLAGISYARSLANMA